MTTIANLSSLPYFTILDANGIIVPGGKCWTYKAGTSELKDSYTDYDSGIAATNPIIADSAGRLEIWLSNDGLYKLTFTDASDNLIRTIDHVGTGGGSGSSLLVNTVIGASSSLRALAAAAATSVTALGYRTVSDNAGGTFRWDAAASGGDNGATVDGNTTYGSVGRWIRLIDGDVNPRWWGCYGNGTDADQSYMTLAIAYALTNSKALHLTQGTYLLSAAVTFSVPIKYDSGAILSFTSFSPAITPIIGINDVSKHFDLPSDDTYTPSFPAGTVVNTLWFGGETNQYAVRQAMKSVSVNGGTVMIPDGTHSTSTQITAYSNVSLIGLGSGSILSVNSGWTSDVALVGNDVATTVVENFHIRDLQLLGLADKSCDGVLIQGKNSSIKNCVIKDFIMDGIILGGTLSEADSTDVEVANNILIDNGSVATSTGHIRLLSGDQLSVHDNQLRSTTVPKFGVYVESSDVYPQGVANGVIRDNNLLCSNIVVAGYDGEVGGIIDNLVIEGNHIEGGTQVDDGITFGVVKAGQGPTGQVRVGGNVISVYGSGCNGINLVGIEDNPDCLDIADNSILLNSSDTSSTAIRLETQSCRTTVHGNSAIASPTPSAACLIREVDTVTDASYNSNLSHQMTGGYVLTGSRYEVLGTNLITEYNGDTTAVTNMRVGGDMTVGGNVTIGGSIYADNIDYTTASGTFDATFQYDGISIPFRYVVFGDDRVNITWPKGADMTGGATQHNAIGYPVPEDIRPVGVNVYQYCPGFAWDYDTNTTGPCYVGIVSNGQMFIGQSPSLTNNTIRLERGGALYHL